MDIFKPIGYKKKKNIYSSLWAMEHNTTDKNLKMTIKTPQEESQLQIGVRLGDLSMVRAALNEGCDPNEASLHGWTPLHEAVFNGCSSITLALLRRGGDPNLQESINRNSALHIAAINGNAKLVQVLLDSGASTCLKNVEGKTPENLASASCKELLERKRIELLMRGGLSNDAKQGCSVQKMYTKDKQGDKELNKSNNNTESLDYEENAQPGPGEIKVSFEFLGRYSELKVNVLEIRDLKLPPDHNYSTLYVKCYLLPDKYKTTKRKTSELRIEMSGSTSIRSGSASSQSSQSSTGSTYSISSIGSGKQISDRFRSVLKKRPHLHSKKNHDEVECMPHSVVRDTVCRASTTINETLSYGSSDLKKINMAEREVHLSVCGRNRYNANGIPIADVLIPLVIGLKKQEPEWFTLEYKINLPVTLCHERKTSQMRQSFELKEGGLYTGRSLAWDRSLAESPTDDTSFSSSHQQGTSCKPSGKSTNSIINKQHKYASRTTRFLKGEMKLFRTKQKPSSRYNNSTDCIIPGQECLSNSMMDSSGSVECIGQSNQDSQANLSISSKNVMDGQIHGLFSTRNWNNSRKLNKSLSNPGFDFSTEEEIEVLNSTFQGSSEWDRTVMKYSRAFGESARKQKFLVDDVAVEDVEDDFDN